MRRRQAAFHYRSNESIGSVAQKDEFHETKRCLQLYYGRPRMNLQPDNEPPVFRRTEEEPLG